MKSDRIKLGARLALAVATVGVGLIATATPAQADTFNLPSCHISTGCPADGTIFGTVTLTQSGTSVNFDVVLNNGSGFVETGAGAGFLFLFNDTLPGSTITNMTATLNGGNFNVVGGLTGVTNQVDAQNQPALHADGTGFLSAGVECTVPSSCNGGSPNQFFNDLHFTVTNATVAQLEATNANGNRFVADIICGAGVTGCAGQTGPVDSSEPAVPDGGLTAGLLGFALVGLETLRRRRRA